MFYIKLIEVENEKNGKLFCYEWKFSSIGYIDWVY